MYLERLLRLIVKSSVLRRFVDRQREAVELLILSGYTSRTSAHSSGTSLASALAAEAAVPRGRIGATDRRALSGDMHIVESYSSEEAVPESVFA